MKTTRRESLALFRSCVLAASMSFTPWLHAQSCAAPQLLQPGAVSNVDTCQASYAPSSMCSPSGAFPTTGPSLVYELIGYPRPGYVFSVTPSSSFDPLIVVQTQQCGTSGYCPFFVENAGPGGAEEFDVGQLDSGVYFIVVTSENGAPYGCGTATISFQSALGGSDIVDGIFRAGFNY